MNLLRTVAVVGIVTLGALAGGCGESPEEMLASAQRHVEERAYRNAIVELKSLLQQKPGDARARWLLSTVYIEIEDGESAEKELRRSGDLGVSDDSTAPLLVRALLLQGKYDEVIGFSESGSLSAATRGEIEALRGIAYLDKGDTAAAAASIEKAKSLVSGGVTVDFAEARLLLAEDKLPDAEAMVEKVVRAVPEYGAAWSLLGDIRFAQKRYDLAEDAYTKSMEVRYANLLDHLRRGHARLARGDFDRAADDAVKLQKRAPKNAPIQYFAGSVYAQQGKFEEAADALELALESRPDHFETAYLMAATQAKLGNSLRAKQIAERAVALRSASIPARKLLAALYVADGRGVDIEGLVRPVVRQDPDDIEAKDLLASGLIMQGKVDEAAELLTEVAAKRRDQVTAQVRAGVSQLLVGEEQKGYASLQRAVELAPERRDANEALVYGLLQRDNVVRAIGAAQQYVALQPEDPAGYNLLGAAFSAGQNEEEAEKAYLKALAIDPGNQTASLRLAAMARTKGDTDAAEKYLRDAAARHPDDARVRVEMAGQALADRRFDDAATELERALAADPEHLAAKVLLARLRITQNRPGEAIELLESAPNDNLTVLSTRADAYLLMKQFANAKVPLEAIRSRAPASPQVLVALSRVYAELGAKADLESTVNALLAAQPDHPYASLLKARLLVLDGRFDEAQTRLQGLDPEHKDSSVLLTRLMIAQGKGDKKAELDIAATLFEQAPTTASVLALANAQVRNGEPEKAVAVLAEWLVEHDRDVAVLRRLSELYVEQGDVNRTVELLQRIVVIDDRDVVAWNNLAWNLRERDPGRALQYAERAMERAPDTAFVLDTYAALLAREGRCEEALQHVDRAVERSGRAPEMTKLQTKIGGICGRAD